MPSDEFTIFPPHEAFYITSLLFCTESAFASTRSLSKLFEEHGEGPYDFAPQPALNQLQNLVLQGAAISRFLWPTGAKYKKRGEALRKALEVTDSSPLFSRTLRNRMEHFDRLYSR